MIEGYVIVLTPKLQIKEKAGLEKWIVFVFSWSKLKGQIQLFFKKKEDNYTSYQ